MSNGLIVEDGTGLSNANSYISIEEADTFHSINIYGSAWSGYDDARKVSALITATRYIDATFRYKGRRLQTSQLLAFPRVFSLADLDTVDIPREQLDRLVPKGVKDATAILASQTILQNIETRVNTSGGGGGSGEVRSISAGSVSIGLSGQTQARQLQPELVTKSVRPYLAPLIRDVSIAVRLNN